ncbi:MAG: hypothetical protein K2L86_05630 [Lachnospiraceae bacterium]|nr:hypothetical protein [Lachnospiraceae bacterium]
MNDFIKSVEKMYIELERMAEAGEVEDAWGGQLLLEFDDLLQCELYPEQNEEPEWVFMFIQLYYWQFASCHEGVGTYYSNFYNVDIGHGIRRLSDCLYQYGFMEIVKWYDYGIYDYNLYPDLDYPDEYEVRMREIDDWIGDHRETIWQAYLKLLQEHKADVLKAAENRMSDCKAKTQEAPEKNSIPASEIQQTKKVLFMRTVDLIACDSTMKKNSQQDGRISCLTASQIDEKMVSLMAEAEELKWIQTKEAFSKEALEVLDRDLFSVRDDILFRIYIYTMQDCDLQHFEDMVHVRRLKLDCRGEIRHVEVLSQYQHLTKLDMAVPKQRDFSFVNRLSQELTTLSLYVDFSLDGVTFEDTGDRNASGSTSMYELEWLLRFPKLHNCYIGSSAQHIEFLIRKDAVRELILCEMPCPSIDVLRMLDLQSVIIHEKHAQGLERLGQMESIQELELVKIEDIDNLDFLETLPALRKLTLRSLPALTRLPHFPEGRRLQELVVYDCDRLTEITAACEKVLTRKYK